MHGNIYCIKKIRSEKRKNEKFFVNIKCKLILQPHKEMKISSKNSQVTEYKMKLSKKMSIFIQGNVE
jgi:hypothetical protein